MASEKYINKASSTLQTTINNSVTTLDVVSAALFPVNPQFRITVEDEIMIVTAITGGTFTVTRGTESTTAASHTSGVAVTHILTKGALDQIISDNCQYGTCAARPSAEKDGRLYFSSNQPMMYRDNGSSWQTFYKGQQVTPPTTSNYTWTHGSPTATNTDTTNGPSQLSIVSNTAGDRLSKFERNTNLAATPNSYIARVSLGLPNGTTYGGIFYGDGTKLVTAGFICESGLTKLWANKWTNLTSYGGEYYRGNVSQNMGDTWLKITDDGTTRTCWFSNDGLAWFAYFGVGRTDFLTATTCGLWIGTNAASGATADLLWISEGN